MNILDNELVRKYLGSCEHGEYRETVCLCPLAYPRRVLEAMQEPIRIGDRFLIQNKNDWEERTNHDTLHEGWHPFALRLPDKFQGKRECCEYHEGSWRGDCTPGKAMPWCGKDPVMKPDLVEEMIQRLRALYESLAPNSRIDFDGLVLDLRGLVRLARETN